MRRLISKRMLTQTLLDIVKVKDKTMMEVCYEVAQYRNNQHFEKSSKVEMMLHTYNSWVMYRINGFFTIMALFLLHFVPFQLRVLGIFILLAWLCVFGVQSWITLRHFHKALPYICVDELFCRNLLRSEIIEK